MLQLLELCSHRCLSRSGFWLVLPLFGLITACATPPQQEQVTSSTEQSRECSHSSNLLLDPSFTREGEYLRVWREAQHTGERSFEVTVQEGTLEISRTGSEPWILLRQTVNLDVPADALLRYAAELKANAPIEPRIHGFDHLAGLYMKRDNNPAKLAEHDPNGGQWDWQTFSIEEELPAGKSTVRVGFVHQADGTLWARNPSLVLLECD